MTFDLDNIQVDDGENVYNKEMSIKQIVLQQIVECNKQLGKELDGGGVKRRFINGVMEEYVAPNQREIFIGCIKALWSLVKPFSVTCPDKFGEELESINTKIKDIELQLKKVREDVLNVMRSKALNNSDAFNLNIRKQKLIFERDTLEDLRVDCYVDKLNLINQLVHALNYFDMGGGVFEV